MKKVMSACLLIVTLFTALITINIFQTKDMINGYNIEQTPQSFNFYINDNQTDPQDALNFLSTVSRKYHASIFLTTSNADNDTVKSVILDQDSFPYQQFGLHAGSLFSNHDDIYASYKTGDSQQVGVIPVFYSKNHIILQTLDHYHADGNTTANGDFTVVPKNNSTKSAILADISNYFGISVKQLQQAKSGHSTSIYNRYFLTFAIVIGIAVLIFILVIIYLPLSKRSDIGVMKLNGWSDGAILWRFIKPGGYILLATSLSIDISALLFLNHRPTDLMQSLVIGQLIIFLLYLLSSSVAYFLIHLTTVADLLKSHFHFEFGTLLSFAAKIMMTIATTVLLIQLSQGISEAWKLYQQNQEWQKNGDVLTINRLIMIENDRDQKALTKIYRELENKTDAMYINHEILAPVEASNSNSERSQFDPKSSYHLLSVNLNYIKQTVPQLLSLAKNTAESRLYLVPRKYQNNKKLNLIIRNAYFSSLSTPEQKQSAPEKVPVTIKYYDDQKLKLSVFAYDQEVDQKLVNPIFSVVDSKNLTDFDNLKLSDTDINNPVKIKKKKQTNKIIQQIIKENHASYLQFHFASLNAILASNLSTTNQFILIMSLLLLLVFGLNIIASIFILLCVIQGEAKTLAIKKLLGIKFTERYRSFLVIISALYAIQFLVVLMFGSSKLISAVVALLITLDMLISIVFIRRQESRNLPLMLKGDL